MNKTYILILFLFNIYCKPQADTAKNILPINTMKEVMWDIIQADEYVSFSIAKDSSKNAKQETLKLYSKIYTSHKVSMENFIHSYSYYTKNPTMGKVLMDSLFTYAEKIKENNKQGIPSILKKNNINK